MTALETPRRKKSQSRDNAEIERPHLILAEGVDEQAVASALISHMDLDNFQVHNMGGKDTHWERSIETLTLSDGFQDLSSLGLFLDADESPGDAWRKCYFALQRNSLAPPTEEGVPSTGSPPCSIFVSPGGSRNGALEELVLDTLEVSVIGCVDAYFNCLENPPSKRLGKKRFRAAAARHDDDVRSVADAARKKLIDLDHPALEGLRTFLAGLANNH